MAKQDNKMYIAVAILAVVAVSGVALIAWKLNTTTVIQNPPQTPQTQWDLTLPLNFIISDKWAGDVMGSTDTITKVIFDMNLNTKETLSGTTVQTTGIYAPNSQYWVRLTEVGSTGTVSWFKYYRLTVPYAHSSSSTLHDIQLDFYTHGNYTTLLSFPNGTAITSYGTIPDGNDNVGYNVTAELNTVPSFTLSFVDSVTTHNNGISATEDPVYGITREPTFEIHLYDWNTTSTAAASCLLTSIPLVYSASSSNKYYAQAIPADILIRQSKPDGTLVSSGIYSTSLTFNCNGMTVGTFTWFVVTMYSMDNLNYFKTYGTHPVSFETHMSTEFTYVISA